jgi:Caspase domain
LSITLPAPDFPPGPRSALIVTTSVYGDSRLRSLRAPAKDAVELAAVLGDPAVGRFAITSLADNDCRALQLNIDDFLRAKKPEETIVVYFSCHGVLTAQRRLYFAASDTQSDRLASTGIDSRWLLERLDECRARQQVVILDCCFAGAFARSKGPEDVGLEQQFGELADSGRGRVVLTASRETEFSFEGMTVLAGRPAGSVFTSALLDGLRTGAADLDRDGFVSASEAYAHAYKLMRNAGEAQTPQRWLFGGEGQEVMLTRSPRGITIEPEPPHEEIKAGLESRFPQVRIGAVEALAAWLPDPNPARAATARMILQEIAEQDVPGVARIARSHLEKHPEGRTTDGTRRASGPHPAYADQDVVAPARQQNEPQTARLQPEQRVTQISPLSVAAAESNTLQPARRTNITISNAYHYRPRWLSSTAPLTTKLGVSGFFVGCCFLPFSPHWPAIIVLVISIVIPVSRYLILDRSQRRRLRAIRARQRY